MVFVGAMGLVLVELLNEPRAVHDSRTLEEGAEACVDGTPDRVDPFNEGKLVHMTGQATADETLRDDQLGVSAPALKLTRTVQIYQWVERRVTHRTGTTGRKTITYTYHHEKRWSAQPIDGGKFHLDSTTGQRPSNAGALPLTQQSWYAKEVRLGSFQLARRQVDKLGPETLPLTKAMFAGLPGEWKGRLTRAAKTLFTCPCSPAATRRAHKSATCASPFRW